MFLWKEKFSCNVEEIDKQHKKLFELASKLYDILKYDRDYDNYDKILAIIRELGEYTVYHFKYEEELLEKYKYPRCFSHMSEHNAFIKKINKFDEKDIDNMQNEVLMDMTVFIADWIENHILETDVQYGKFLNENGVY